MTRPRANAFQGKGVALPDKKKRKEKRNTRTARVTTRAIRLNNPPMTPETREWFHRLETRGNEVQQSGASAGGDKVGD